MFVLFGSACNTFPELDFSKKKRGEHTRSSLFNGMLDDDARRFALSATDGSVYTMCDARGPLSQHSARTHARAQRRKSKLSIPGSRSSSAAMPLRCATACDRC
jgi:hypothetical protein